MRYALYQIVHSREAVVSKCASLSKFVSIRELAQFWRLHLLTKGNYSCKFVSKTKQRADIFNWFPGYGMA